MHDDLREATRAGMALAYWAGRQPDVYAIVSPYGDRTFGELNARANALARALRSRGLVAGDAIALLLGNRPEFAEAVAAAQRAGLRFTPVNWHLTGDEAGYIVDDCDAKAFVADARYADAAARAAQCAPGACVRLAVGGAIDGFERYDDAIDSHEYADLEDPVAGSSMLYTSGTTGRPKGVRRKATPSAVGNLFGYRPGDDVHLCTGPLYHAAPLAFSLVSPLHAGVGVVVMDGWDADETLRLIARHHVTHSHMVPTMFHRLLSLPDDVRARADVSALRLVLHGAAPCPVHVKQTIIDWWGPVLLEYYAATEGLGTFVTSEEWLARPGTVGKPFVPESIRVLDEHGADVPPGVVGTVYLKSLPGARFEYHHDPAKTDAAYDGEFFTLGDVGRLDEDGYLYLTDRSSELIISGGVNVYPAEVEAELLAHPAVADAAVIGVPDDDLGETVIAVVETRAGVEASDALATELVAFCRDRIAHYKCPRSVDFVDALPRHDNGKLYRRLLRDRYRAAERAQS
jgi:long-chain acyl-CoA synthetase